MSTSEAMTALENASQGLLYQSETDEPFAVFKWKADGELTAGKVLNRLRKAASTPVEEITLKEFFANPTKEYDWHGEGESDSVKRYRTLLKAIKEHLSGVKVLRVGQRQVGVYIVGTTDEGEWVGLKTKAVET